MPIPEGGTPSGWTTDGPTRANAANFAVPTGGEQASGFVQDQKPTRPKTNYLFGILLDWTKWFNDFHLEDAHYGQDDPGSVQGYHKEIQQDGPTLAGDQYGGGTRALYWKAFPPNLNTQGWRLYVDSPANGATQFWWTYNATWDHATLKWQQEEATQVSMSVLIFTSDAAAPAGQWVYYTQVAGAADWADGAWVECAQFFPNDGVVGFGRVDMKGGAYALNAKTLVRTLSPADGVSSVGTPALVDATGNLYWEANAGGDKIVFPLNLPGARTGVAGCVLTAVRLRGLPVGTTLQLRVLKVSGFSSFESGDTPVAILGGAVTSTSAAWATLTANGTPEAILADGTYWVEVEADANGQRIGPIQVEYTRTEAVE